MVDHHHHRTDSLESQAVIREIRLFWLSLRGGSGCDGIYGSYDSLHVHWNMSVAAAWILLSDQQRGVDSTATTADQEHRKGDVGGGHGGPGRDHGTFSHAMVILLT